MLFYTASLIDVAPKTPSCETQFKQYGKKNRFKGKIRTIRCHQDNGLVKQLMSRPSDGEILVIDGGGSYYSALMGDMIATAGMNNGWAGAIIYGAIRDSQLINTLDFGVKALGTNPRKSTKEGTGQVDIPIHFGGVIFIPGHYLYSDEDGILVAASPIEL